MPEPSTPPGPDRRAKLTLREAADLCHVDYDTFLRWVAKGLVPYLEVGPFRRKMVYERDVQPLIKEIPAEFS